MKCYKVTYQLMEVSTQTKVFTKLMPALRYLWKFRKAIEWSFGIIQMPTIMDLETAIKIKKFLDKNSL